MEGWSGKVGERRRVCSKLGKVKEVGEIGRLLSKSETLVHKIFESKVPMRHTFEHH